MPVSCYDTILPYASLISFVSFTRIVQKNAWKCNGLHPYVSTSFPKNLARTTHYVHKADVYP